MDYVALDIGGANLKIANGTGFAHCRNFPLWKHPGRLAYELRSLISEGPATHHLFVTMTGELADCFACKAAGVRFILEAVREAADGRQVRVYLTNGSLVIPQIASTQTLLAAASNWHALAAFAGRFARRGSALLFDLGSTTCDLIPLLNGITTAAGRTDTERLVAGELVYTGIQRSPICALVETVPYRGLECPVAQELFATTWDAYLILEELPEDPADSHTADSQPATRPAACTRIGRMICADSDQFDHRDAVTIAQAVAAAQIAKIAVALKRVIDRMPSPPETVILSGHGDFLARRVIEHLGFASRKIVSLAAELGPSVSRCACAHALAVLAREGAARK